MKHTYWTGYLQLRISLLNYGNTLPSFITIYVCRKLDDIEAANHSSASNLRQDLLPHGFWSHNIFWGIRFFLSPSLVLVQKETKRVAKERELATTTHSLLFESFHNKIEVHVKEDTKMHTDHFYPPGISTATRPTETRPSDQTVTQYSYYHGEFLRQVVRDHHLPTEYSSCVSPIVC